MDEHSNINFGTWLLSMLGAIGGTTGIIKLWSAIGAGKRKNRDAVIAEWKGIADRLGDRVSELESQLERAQDKYTTLLLENSRLKGKE